MARLRVRIELNRGGVGVPLHKLVSVVDETQKFLQMLAEDVHIGAGKGEWLGFNFEQESLYFTAEYIGPVTPEQVQAFYAAFDGTTRLRRGTIAQFARITSAIGEDELIGFGLYQSEEGTEPTEWRCLSRRDALRIADEIQLLALASGEPEGESHLPASTDANAVARVFGDRRERAEQGKLAELVREVEAALSGRITRVESKVEDHSTVIQDLRSKSAATEESFRSLLAAVETFVDQATHQFERLSGPAALAAAPDAPKHGFVRRWRVVAAVAALAVVVVSAGVVLRNPRSADPVSSGVVAASAPPPGVPPVSAAPVSTARPIAPPAAAQPAVTAPAKSKIRIDLNATEPTWVSLTKPGGDRVFVGLLVAGDSRTFEVAEAATLRLGNAGGVAVRLQGKPMGSIGPHGGVRQVEFKNGEFRIYTP